MNNNKVERMLLGCHGKDFVDLFDKQIGNCFLFITDTESVFFSRL